MIPLQTAQELILEHAPTMATESVVLGDLLGRVLAQPVDAPMDLPMFTGSAVDGFAVRSADLAEPPVKLMLAATVPAGTSTPGTLEARRTVRVFTGSQIPEGSDAVVMQEDVDLTEGAVLFSQSTRAGRHVRYQGEEVRKGDPVLPPGTLVDPPVLGVLSTLGLTRLEAYKRPRFGIVGTGNELMPPGVELRPGQIYESNTLAISAAVRAMGGIAEQVHHCPDDVESVEVALRNSLATEDAIITCGGVSVGDFDLVREAAKRVGIREVFWRVAMKPGKPFFFGLSETGQPFFGLPGNPVSALVTFFVLVRPALKKMQGLDPIDIEWPAVLKGALESEAGRTEFVRGTLKTESGRLVASPTEAQGSHMLSGLALADCLIRVPVETTHIALGEGVLVSKLQWGLY